MQVYSDFLDSLFDTIYAQQPIAPPLQVIIAAIEVISLSLGGRLNVNAGEAPGSQNVLASSATHCGNW